MTDRQADKLDEHASCMISYAQNLLRLAIALIIHAVAKTGKYVYVRSYGAAFVYI